VKHWDYVVALDERPSARAVAVEVHTATSDGEATALVEKKDTAARALAQELPRLEVLGLHWLMRGGRSAVRKGSRSYRLLVEAAIEGPSTDLDLATVARRG
jgi:NADPH-dependent ferric siderophore reductase